MEKGGNPSVYFVYHGGCPDGFFSALVFDVWRLAAGDRDLKDLLKQAFGREQKLTMDPPTSVPGEQGIKDYLGKADKVTEWDADNGSYTDITYFKIMYTSVESNLKDIGKCTKKKDIAIIIDIGNLEVLEKLAPMFEVVYFLDHHQSALDGGLNNPDYLEKFKNVTFFYDTKVSACKLIYSVLLKDGGDILQSHFSKDFGDNLTKMVDTISRGDTNSTLNLHEFERQFKSGFCSLSDVQSFSKNASPVHLRKIANYHFDILQKLGKSVVEEIEKSILPELEKAEIGKYTYQSVTTKKEVSMTFLMVYSNSKYRSDLGNYLSQASFEEGFDPVSLVYTEYGGKKDYYKVSWRALDLPSHEHINLSEVSSFFNGGGHKHASGAEMTNTDIDKLRCKNLKRKKTSSPAKNNSSSETNTPTEKKVEDIDWKLEPEEHKE
jgi:oligoribonuclease NrnB/cAMP/cGMP phosphodiesterase (DHH superfamily)